MKIKFKKNNETRYMQDFSFCQGVPSGINFDVEMLSHDKIKLSTNGYGHIGRNYGNGALFVLVKHLPKSIQNKIKRTVE